MDFKNIPEVCHCPICDEIDYKCPKCHTYQSDVRGPKDGCVECNDDFYTEEYEEQEE